MEGRGRSLLLLPDDPAASASATASSGFESSESFAAVPLQPVPRFPSGPISAPFSGGFLSGPIERGFLSGPLDAALLSGPLPGAAISARMGGAVLGLRRSLSHGGRRLRNFTRALLARTEKFQGSADLGSPDAAAAVAACGFRAGLGVRRHLRRLQRPRRHEFPRLQPLRRRPPELCGLLWEQQQQEQQQDQLGRRLAAVGVSDSDADDSSSNNLFQVMRAVEDAEATIRQQLEENSRSRRTAA